MDTDTWVCLKAGPQPCTEETERGRFLSPRRSRPSSVTTPTTPPPTSSPVDTSLWKTKMVYARRFERGIISIGSYWLSGVRGKTDERVQRACHTPYTVTRDTGMSIHTHISSTVITGFVDATIINLSKRCLTMSVGMVLVEATPIFSTHTTASRIDPSLNLRKPAFSPQNLRKSWAYKNENK